MPENETEDDAFVSYLLGGGGGDCDGLSIDHLAHDATRAVGGAHQNGIDAELLRRNALQAAEERVGRSIAAGKSDPEPSKECAEERVEPAAFA